MHFNLEMEKDSNGKFKPMQGSGCGRMIMQYLDNRFYGVDGEVVIAGLTQEDKGENLVTSGKVILPFPL